LWVCPFGFFIAASQILSFEFEGPAGG